MAAITIQRIGKYSYINLSTSHWDSEAQQCRNSKVNIGKLDFKTGEPIFKIGFLKSLDKDHDLKDRLMKRFPTYKFLTEYTSDIDSEGTSVSIKAYPGDSIRFGILYFLYNIAVLIGLSDILINVFPTLWKKIFIIATYLIVENDALMYCDDFMSDHLCFSVGNLNSQRCSDLLGSITRHDINLFYNKWYELIRENEYIALDTTSISSYSKDIPEVNWGRNKQDKSLKQVNICLLFGEISHLPVYQTIYSGSMVDVATLCSTIEEFESIVGTSKLTVVMDKGFYSDKNLRALLNKKDIKFIIAVPFTSKKANLLVEEIRNSDELLMPSNLVTTQNESIRGIYRSLIWHNNIKLHTHIYYDAWNEKKAEDKLLKELSDIKKLYLSGQLKNKDTNELNKYFIINNNYPKSHKKHIVDNFSAIKNELKNTGWLILISNKVKNSQKCHQIYRKKDTVEKAFESYKHNLGIKRFYIKSSHMLNSKSFIAFIALIIKSHIDKVMEDNKMFSKYTFNKLIRHIDNIKCFFNADDEVFIKEVLASQNEIFKSFNITPTNTENLLELVKLL
jgi:transposase